MSIAENIALIRKRIHQVCERIARDPNDIAIVAVSKTFPVAAIREAVAAGIRIFGENRVQEAMPKYLEIGDQVEWHMVGHLQSNKVKQAMQFARVIESVDSLPLAQEIDKRAQHLGRQVEIFIEVNTSGEKSKFGVAPQDCESLVGTMSQLPWLRINGLMTIGLMSNDPENARPGFRELRQLRDRLCAAKLSNAPLQHLSMGMSDDFQVAIEEGATLIRLGRAIFGAR